MGIHNFKKLNSNLYYLTALAMTKNYSIIKIGNHNLRLDLRWKHEKIYYQEYSSGIPDYDAEIARHCLKRGDLVLDLGANIGFNSLHYLEMGACKVYAIEPVKEIYDRLQSIKDESLVTINCAVGDTDCEGIITISTSHNQGSTLDPDTLKVRDWIFGINPKKQKVKVCKLDTLFPTEMFDFLKIDVEGFEMEVINGGKSLFQDRTPRYMQIEIKDEFIDEYLSKLLNIYPYIYRVYRNKATGIILFKSINDKNLPPENFTNRPPNYLCSLTEI